MSEREQRLLRAAGPRPVQQQRPAQPGVAFSTHTRSPNTQEERRAERRQRTVTVSTQEQPRKTSGLEKAVQAKTTVTREGKETVKVLCCKTTEKHV